MFVNSSLSCQNTLVISIHFLDLSFPLYFFPFNWFAFHWICIYEKKLRTGYTQYKLHFVDIFDMLQNLCIPVSKCNHDNRKKNQGTLCCRLRNLNERAMLCIFTKRNTTIMNDQPTYGVLPWEKLDSSNSFCPVPLPYAYTNSKT